MPVLIKRRCWLVHFIKTACCARGKCCSGYFFKSVTFAVAAFCKQQVVWRGDIAKHALAGIHGEKTNESPGRYTGKTQKNHRGYHRN